MILNHYFDTIILFLAYNLSIISIAGYGIILNNLIFKADINYEDHGNTFSLFFLGLPLLMLVGFFNYILLGYFQLLNLIIISFGGLVFFHSFSISKRFFKIFFIPTLLFVGLIISKSHTDFQFYHFQHLNELINGNLKIGLANLVHRYGSSSLFAYIQAIFYLPYLDLKLFHLPSYLIYVCLVSYIFDQRDKVKEPKLKFFIYFMFVLIIFQINRLSEFGYDYITQFILIFLFVEYFINNNIKNNDLFKILVYFAFATCVKVTSVFFLPVIIFILFLNQKFNFNAPTKIRPIIFVAVLAISFISNSFIKTGCLFYAFKNTCFDKKTVPWVIDYQNFETEKKQIFAWSKGYMTQGPNKISSRKIYLEKFNWIENWIDKHFFYKISEFLARILFVFCIIYFLCISDGVKKYRFKSSLLMAGSALLGVIFWFMTIPTYRFGFASILIAMYFLLSISLKENFKINRKKINILITIVLLFFNYKNVNIIYDYTSREGFYHFTTFPWYKLPERKFLKVPKNGEESVMYYKPSDKKDDIITQGIGKYCWNIPTPCAENEKDINIKKYKFFSIIKEID